MNQTLPTDESSTMKAETSNSLPLKQKTGESQTLPKSLEEATQENYMCSICISWLEDPVLTKCGHRFCSSCLNEWRTKKNSKCPIDSLDLSSEDIFPDNYTKRHITEIRKSFPEDKNPPTVLHECRFSTVSCDFKTISASELDQHMKEATKDHIDYLLSSYLKSQYQAWDPLNKNSDKEELLKNQSTTRDLINAMFERIVILEQQSREQAIKIERLLSLEKRHGHGTLVWKIEDFKRKIESMQTNSNMMFYSTEAYTTDGYKFCARINLSHKMKDYLSLHVHLMKSENDYHLSWPFIGRIKISMIHTKNPTQSQHDCIMSKPEILAFHRPMEEINCRGFGFTEYAIISDIIKKGFVENDCLVIKIQMNIV